MAPKRRAVSRRSADGSDTTIMAAPAMRAPWVTATPMPPAPSTRTVAPGSTAAVFSTAPTPVWTAQPITQATSRGTSGSTLTTATSGMIVSSPQAAVARPRKTGDPCRDSGVVPSGSSPVKRAMLCTWHSVGWPRTQK